MEKEIDELYQKAFDLVEIRLDKKEDIIPFAVVRDSNLEPKILMNEISNSLKNLEALRNEIDLNLEKTKDQIVCTCYVVQIVDPRDQVEKDAVLFELVDGESRECVYLPFKVGEEFVEDTPFKGPKFESN